MRSSAFPPGSCRCQPPGSALVAEAVRALTAAGLEVSELGLRRPTLDDVFLTLTGHLAEDSAEEATG